MFDIAPFEETLYLDIDTTVLGRLDFAFDKAIKHDVACSICECPWARRYVGVSGDIIEYNTGVLFFTKKAKPLFDAWAECATKFTALQHIVDNNVIVVPLNDQGGFAVAADTLGFSPFTLPLNWNFRPEWQYSFFGPIKIWHDYGDVPEAVQRVNEYYEGTDSIVQFAWAMPSTGKTRT
jgi:hypothetical protein